MADTIKLQNWADTWGENIDEGKRKFMAWIVWATVLWVSWVARELIWVTPANAQETQVASLDQKYIDLIEPKYRESVKEHVAVISSDKRKLQLFNWVVKTVLQSPQDEKMKSRALVRMSRFLATEPPADVDMIDNSVKYVPSIENALLQAYSEMSWIVNEKDDINGPISVLANWCWTRVVNKIKA